MGILVMLLNHGTRVNEGRDGACGALASVDIVTRSILNIRANVGELRSHVLLAATKLRRIDSDEESLAASLFGMLHNALGDLAILVHVELQPLDLAGLGFVHDLVEGT
jgi:hypothetical protein